MEQETSTTIETIVNTIIEFFVNYSFQVLGAIIILVIGVMIANSVAKVMFSFFESKKLDVTLSKFIAGVVKFLIIGFAVIVALGKFGISIAPFVAALGALAFGASFAIQGPLSNYGAGLSIILTQPFKVGDTVTVADVSGIVEEVKLACTILTNEDGIKITIPNKHIVGEIVQNSKANKVVEGVIGISYDSNPDQAIEIVRGVLAKYEQIVQEPAPQVGVQEFADSSVNIAFRYWVPTKQFFQTSYAVNLDVFKAFNEANITIPFPQRDLHIVSQPTGSSSLT